jgi:hypothetical protein
MSDLVTTRRSLHGVAELLLAGPQQAECGTIRLTPAPGGFATKAAAEIAAAFERGQSALRSFRPDVTAVLWPEHFDLGITVDEVNYGVSPGDDHVAVPYAYVGPWAFAQWERAGPFWNAPFGAARPLTELPSLAAWFAEGAELVGSDDTDR